jgi:GntR family transcriptional regulator/MocR family aminotransferase
LTLEPAPGPLYLKVAQALLREIRAGRLAPGQALPGVRTLAGRLDVTVNTVLAALREIQDQGWILSHERSGFFVVDPLPATPKVPQHLSHPPSDLGFDLPAHLSPITSNANVVMDFSISVADARLAPAQALGRSYQRGLRLKGSELLGSRDARGLLRLRASLAEHFLPGRGLEVSPSQVLILRSTAMAVTLVAQALLGSSGGVVGVETPGDSSVWETLRQACPADLHGLPVDGEGLQVEVLERLLEASPGLLRLLVVTPQCHFPTGAALSAPRRIRLLDLARRHRFPILELDPEYDYLPVPGALPLASQDGGQVLYAGSLSRTLAPGLCASYLIAPEPLAGLLARARQRIDWQGDPVQEWALAELLLDGELPRQILRVRKAALDRREAVADALRHALAPLLDFDEASAGMALWLRGRGPLADPQPFGVWVRGCQARGLKLRLGRAYDLDGRDLAATRLGFTAHTPEELQHAVALMS